jgi:hypothetical protein
MRQLNLDLHLNTGTAGSRTLDPRATIQGWADLAHDLPALAGVLGALGWTYGALTAGGQQLTITGPSGIRIVLWQGLERSSVMVQLSLGWLGPMGVMTDRP